MASTQPIWVQIPPMPLPLSVVVNCQKVSTTNEIGQACVSLSI